jgi:hypothetical protein
MAQALSYGNATVSMPVSPADAALQSAVSALPTLPSVAAEAEADEAAADSSSTQSATQDPQEKPSSGPSRKDAPPKKQVTAANDNPSTALAVAADPIDPKQTAEQPPMSKDPGNDVSQPVAAALEAPALMPEIAAVQPPTAVVVDPAGVAPAMSIVVDSDPLRHDGRAGQGWTISGHFPAAETSPLPTALAIVIVMVLSAASAYGFVRLMCEKCPYCGALLQKHSAGCLNCGSQLHSPGADPDLRLLS